MLLFYWQFFKKKIHTRMFKISHFPQANIFLMILLQERRRAASHNINHRQIYTKEERTSHTTLWESPRVEFPYLCDVLPKISVSFIIPERLPATARLTGLRKSGVGCNVDRFGWRWKPQNIWRCLLPNMLMIVSGFDLTQRWRCVSLKYLIFPLHFR